MRTKLVQIGNSRGIRLPKPVIEQVGLTDEVELDVREGEIVISPAGRARVGWSDAAKTLSERNEDRLLDEPTPTSFDESEWEW